MKMTSRRNASDKKTKNRRALLLALGIGVTTLGGAVAPSVALAAQIPGISIPQAGDPKIANLFEAVRAGDYAAVQAALTAGADVNLRDEENRTPLMLASRLGRNDLVSLLLDHKADPNAADGQGRTALHHILSAAGEGAAKPKKKRGLGSFLGQAAGVLGGGGALGKIGGLVPGQLLSSLGGTGLGQSLLSQAMPSLLVPGSSFDVGNKGQWSAVLGAALLGNDGGVLQALSGDALKNGDPDAWTRLIQHAGRNKPEVLAAMGNLNASVGTPESLRSQWSGFLQAAARGDTRAVQSLLSSSPELSGLLGSASQGLTGALDALPGRDGGAGIARMLLERGRMWGLRMKRGRRRWAARRAPASRRS